MARPRAKPNHYRGWYQVFVGLWQTLWHGGPAGQDDLVEQRVLLVGLAGAGKSTLYNHWHGSVVSTPDIPQGHGEDLGLFQLVDLPDDATSASTVPPVASFYQEETVPKDGAWGYAPPYDMGYGNSYGSLRYDSPIGGAATAIVFVVDSEVGMTSATYRWFWRMQAKGVPLVVAWNKCEGRDDSIVAAEVRRIGEQLAVPVVAVSAATGLHVIQPLLSRLVDLAPELLLPLGRDIAAFRPRAAARLIESTVLMGGMMGFEPVPLLDMPLQMALELRLVSQLAALYGRMLKASGGVIRREFVLTVLATSVVRYTAQQMAKLVPVVGWLVSGGISLLGTLTIGWMAARYFERQGRGSDGHRQKPPLRVRLRWRAGALGTRLREMGIRGWRWRKHRPATAPRQYVLPAPQTVETQDDNA